MPLETSYRYLNAAGSWPGARGDLVSDELGRLRLAPGPAGAERLVEVQIDPDGGIAGLAAAPDGTLYLADPGGGRVLRVDPCDQRVESLGCADTAGGDPFAPVTPRGLAVAGPGTLLIADAGGGRVIAIDRSGGAVIDVRDDFDAPWDVAVDARGRVLVCDAAAGTVRRFEPDGVEDAAFAAAVAELPDPLSEPRALAVLPGDGVAVVDGGDGGRVLALDATGRLDADETPRLGALPAAEVLALMRDGATVWAAGPAGALALTADTLARGDAMPVFGVARACNGSILVAAADGIYGLAAGGAGASGALVIRAPEGLLPWDRVRVLLAEPLPSGSHVRVWTRTETQGAPDPAPPPPGDDSEAPQPSPVGTWRSAPLDVLDLRPLCEPAHSLWIALELFGDGLGSATVDDIRVDHMGRGWLEELPHILIPDDPDPLERLLALIASVYEDTAEGIGELVERLDPAAAPDRVQDPWLERLARWVAIEFPVRLSAGERRRLVADALAVHERRGTVRGVVDAVRREVGIDVEIVEPDPPAAWALGGGGLAFGSGLPPSPAGPAVLDTTAVVNRSWLIDPADRGLPLLGGVAHRFCVVGSASDLSDADVLAAVRRVVEREKPAATVFDIRALEARTVVGAQSRVGVDSLTGPSPHGPAPGRVGRTTFVGDPDSERTVLGHD